MKVPEAPVQWIIDLGELIRPKNEYEKRYRTTTALIIALGAAAVLFYLYLN